MSPKIAVSIPLGRWVPDRRTPRQRAMAAVAEMRAQGTPLRDGALGVEGGNFAWVIDRKSIPRGVNVVGAYLLAQQPDRIGDEDPNATVARALGVTLAWVEGMADGWDLAPHNRYWVDKDTTHQNYLNGYAVGAEVLFTATLVCECGVRRFKGEDICPACDGLGHER